ncbi:MAG TPA: 50S ribosomal protein L10 [Candidatus Marinimicrobia bacterium]|nr:MAG: 50S ribosomal protein L10 [Candidatus Marinimicrobia bacterium CG1_02_48_14]PIZ64117.1 MAG: 50S ribosomal protein L10 [Candidatus Marinimicrobia bacterium CG_4_10_14_0_2_um_filter_48_9]PJA53734.1 MAG: 50S ribosomal protein L10 [Candidatus Marinimicrobia bacterium CG_4_9_14_3_um_filter_48_9]HCW76590.1 50S ribosomal protein L10 [Candidatus Neomarinimicrobiota bacterium]
MPNTKNIQAVEVLEGKLSKASSAFFTDYMGLNSAELSILRTKFHEAGIEYRVVKNTLMAYTAKKLGFEGLENILQGPTAVALGYSDPTAAARVIKDFLKGVGKVKERPAVKGMIFDGDVYGADKFDVIANLPTKEELLARLLGGLQSPMQSVMSVLQAPMRDLVGVLTSLNESKN